jgi:hypothetical protein
MKGVVAALSGGVGTSGSSDSDPLKNPSYGSGDRLT